jgi:hypothetical protein
MIKNLTFIILGIVIYYSVSAQNPDCLSDFNYLVNKIKTDYPGYHDKVTKATEKELADLELKLREKIAIHPDSCGTYLDEYVSWFSDFHLKVRYNWSKHHSGSGSKQKVAPLIIELNNDTLKTLSNKVNTIEGIWVSFWGKVAIMKRGGENKYVGIVIQQQGYKPGQVMFEFTAGNDQKFGTDYYDDPDYFKPVHTLASLHLGDKILEIHEYLRFARQSNSTVYDYAFLASYRAQYPNGLNIFPLAFYLSDSTFYMRVTDFGDDLAGRMVKSHWKEIMARPFLVLDIRNNGGGQDEYYQPLSDLIYTNPFETKGVEWYASEGNIHSIEEAIRTGDIKDGDDNLEWTKVLLSAMKKNPGGFVINPSGGQDGIIKGDTIYKNPRRVGIIINEGNGSTAEQFLLEAKESKKVLLFGNQHTAGCLDYSNLAIEEFPSGKYNLIYPMTRSRRLPEHPIDNIGIAPDIMIPFPATEQLYGRLDDWVYFVKEYLEYKE